MSLGTPVAADVPALFDVVINGKGYVFDRAQDPRAIYTYSPTFVERQNVQGDYGDNQQDFWLTFSQKDWSLGEGQRYFRSSDPDKARRYWVGSNVDVTTVPGQVAMSPAAATSGSLANSITFMGPIDPFDFASYQSEIIVGDATNVQYLIATPATFSSGTSHGMSDSPITMAWDGLKGYFSDGGKVKKVDSTAAVTSFSNSGAYSVAYLNNTLYGLGASGSASQVLYRWDTAGTRTTIFTWKGADGTAQVYQGELLPFGGKLAILLVGKKSGIKDSVWLYDGTAPAMIANFPTQFNAYQMVESNGVLYVTGRYTQMDGNGLRYVYSIYYYANGSTGVLWESQPTTTSGACVATAWNSGIVFTSPGTNTILYYNTETGGVSTILTPSPQQSHTAKITSNSAFVAIPTATGNKVHVWPTSTTASVATITTSLFDGDSSLDKYFKAVKVDFDLGSDGNGGSVDIAYQINTVEGSYATVQTGVTAGTEYTIGQSARSISIRVTLNRGTSTLGPVLKRVFVRGAPVKQSFPLRDYILDLTGRNGKGHVTLNNGRTHPLDGYAQALQLVTAITSTTPVSVTDRFGTYTAILEPDGCSFREIRPEEFVGTIRVRGT